MMFKRSFKQNEKDNAVQSKNVLSDASEFTMKEAYKALRTNILFSLASEGCKCILVTSSQPSDGKSTNCVNTAIAFAQTGAKVLLIDCDLRRPNIGRILSTRVQSETTAGVSNLLVNLAALPDVIHRTDIEGLDLIFSGDIPPNPAELLASPKMAQIIVKLREDYDYIFIDSPPVNTVTDASILSQYADGVLVIVRQNYTEKKAVAEAVKQLNFAGAKILGFVFNAVGHSIKGYGRYGYYKYRKYSYSSYYGKGYYR